MGTTGQIGQIGLGVIGQRYAGHLLEAGPLLCSVNADWSDARSLVAATDTGDWQRLRRYVPANRQIVTPSWS